MTTHYPPITDGVDLVAAADTNAPLQALSDTIEDLRDGTLDMSAPTIVSHENANHNHSNAANGGLVAEAAVSAVAGDIGKYLKAITDGGSGALSSWEPVPGSDLTSKGDLQGHNGTTGVRVPVGPNTHVLIADSTQATGLRWGARTQMAAGNYTGSGTAIRVITGLGFRPEVVMIFPRGSSYHSFWKTSGDGLMAGSFIGGLAYQADIIISLDADGFTVGDATGLPSSYNPNANAVVYNYIAWRIN